MAPRLATASPIPWKNGVARKVAQGNNNPPPGSHDGSQSFAFDFTP